MDSRFLTTGQIAEALDVDRDAVAYAVRKLHLNTVGRVGITRIFEPSAIDAVRTFLASKRRRFPEVER
ncbi:MAG: hypothetical protein ACOYLD_15115 [Anaerohalosphaeraceae bacterium]|jgi:hypothetical protein